MIESRQTISLFVLALDLTDSKTTAEMVTSSKLKRVDHYFRQKVVRSWTLARLENWV